MTVSPKRPHDSRNAEVRLIRGPAREVVSAVAHKRKRAPGGELARVRWLRRDARAALTVDRYEDEPGRGLRPRRAAALRGDKISNIRAQRAVLHDRNDEDVTPASPEKPRPFHRSVELLEELEPDAPSCDACAASATGSMPS